MLAIQGFVDSFSRIQLTYGTEKYFYTM
jgi:hypothetical protein